MKILRESEESIDDNKIAWAKKAVRLNRIISSMNNEDAYVEWLYTWPDGETFADATYDYGTEEDYKELEEEFKEIYSNKYYHDAGLYFNLRWSGNLEFKDDIIEDAHKWDKELGLPEIEVFIG